MQNRELHKTQFPGFQIETELNTTVIYQKSYFSNL